MTYRGPFSGCLSMTLLLVSAPFIAGVGIAHVVAAAGDPQPEPRPAITQALPDNPCRGLTFFAAADMVEAGSAEDRARVAACLRHYATLLAKAMNDARERDKGP
jgi:hypothetical protein